MVSGMACMSIHCHTSFIIPVWCNELRNWTLQKHYTQLIFMNECWDFKKIALLFSLFLSFPLSSFLSLSFSLLPFPTCLLLPIHFFLKPAWRPIHARYRPLKTFKPWRGDEQGKRKRLRKKYERSFVLVNDEERKWKSVENHCGFPSDGRRAHTRNLIRERDRDREPENDTGKLI